MGACLRTIHGRGSLVVIVVAVETCRSPGAARAVNGTREAREGICWFTRVASRVKLPRALRDLMSFCQVYFFYFWCDRFILGYSILYAVDLS